MNIKVNGIFYYSLNVMLLLNTMKGTVNCVKNNDDKSEVTNQVILEREKRTLIFPFNVATGVIILFYFFFKLEL